MTLGRIRPWSRIQRTIFVSKVVTRESLCVPAGSHEQQDPRTMSSKSWKKAGTTQWLAMRHLTPGRTRRYDAQDVAHTGHPLHEARLSTSHATRRTAAHGVPRQADRLRRGRAGEER